MTLDLARNILGAFPAPVFGCLRGQNSKDLTVRQLAVLLAIEDVGPVSTEKLVASLPGTHAQLARPLDQLLDRLLLSYEKGEWRLTLKGKAVLDTAPDRQPAKWSTADALKKLDADIKVIDARKELLHSVVAVPQGDGTLRVHVKPALLYVDDKVSIRKDSLDKMLVVPHVKAPVLPPQPQLVVDAEQAVARLELQYKDDRSPRLFEALNQAYADLDEARACAKAEGKPGPKAKPRKPKHKEA